MHMMHRLWVLLLILASVSCAPLDSSTDGEYEIRLSPPAVVGDTSVDRWKVHRRDLKEGSVDAELLVHTEVTAVTERGQPNGIRYTVRSASAKVNGQATPAPKPGTVIEYTRITGDEMPIGIPTDLHPVLTERLNQLFLTDPDFDEFFGTKTRESVGDSWTIDYELFRNYFMENVSLADAALVGKSMLKGIVNMGGVECVHVTTRVVASGVELDPPQGLTQNRGVMNMNFSWYIPVDAASHPVRFEISRNTEHGGHFANGAKALAMEEVNFSVTYGVEAE